MKHYTISSKILAILLGAICALGAYIILFTDGGHRIQSAITESDPSAIAETQLVKENDTISLTSHVTATNVRVITGEILYNPESLKLSDEVSSDGTINIHHNGSTSDFTLTYSTPVTIKMGQPLFSIKYQELAPDRHVVNLSNVIITMSDGEKILSTAGTGEF